jgi:isoleucyl-tRNA synthetase
MKTVNQIISGFDQEIIRNIEQTGAYELYLDGEAIVLKLEDFLISSEDIPGWQVASEGGVTVALDITIDESLKAEGTARELVNRIQNLRKENDFQVTDRIRIELEGNAYIIPAVEQFGDYIRNEVLASDLVIKDTLDQGHVVVIDEVDIHIVIQKAE